MSYALPDDPRPSALARRASDQRWPMLTLMLAGPLAGFLWLAFNAHALGCRDAWRQTGLALGVALVAKLAALAVVAAYVDGQIAAQVGASDRLVTRLILLVLVGLQLGVAMAMGLRQGRAEELRGIFGPPLGNGAGVFAAALAVTFLVVPRVPVLGLAWGWVLL